MTRLMIVNHSYHLDYIRDDIEYDLIVLEASSVRCPVVGRVRFCAPIFELLPLCSKLLARRRVINRLKKIALTYDEVYLFGAQDYYSWALGVYLVDRGRPVNVVADNAEFFLRPSTSFAKRTFRGAVKSCFYGVLPNWLSNDVSEFCGRLVYSVKKFNLVRNMGLIYSSNIENMGPSISHVFVSQPYYLDYDIDLEIWSKCILNCLHRVKDVYGSCAVRFHPRDSKEFRCALLAGGFEEAPGESSHYVGLFSTFLLLEATRGKEVYSLFSLVEDLLPELYVEYVSGLANNLCVDLNMKERWSVDFDSAIEMIA